MKTNKNIQDKIDNTFHAIESMEQVSVSHFFKDKTMQRLFSEKEVEKVAWSWFSPKLQLATLACVVLINVYAVKQINSSKYDDSISSFASDYGITTENESSIFNF